MVRERRTPTGRRLLRILRLLRLTAMLSWLYDRPNPSRRTWVPTTTHQPISNVVRAMPEEQPALEQLGHQIDEISRQHGTAQLVDPDGETTEIPQSVLHALKFAVSCLARGQLVTLVPHDKELTTQEAASLLHVSRPHLIKLLDEGAIPHHKVGTHRRVPIEDLLAYRDQRATARRVKLDELTQLSEELPGGYM